MCACVCVCIVCMYAYLSMSAAVCVYIYIHIHTCIVLIMMRSTAFNYYTCGLEPPHDGGCYPRYLASAARASTLHLSLHIHTQNALMQLCACECTFTYTFTHQVKKEYMPSQNKQNIVACHPLYMHTHVCKYASIVYVCVYNVTRRMECKSNSPYRFRSMRKV
jgi:hypothetical protein